MMDFDDDDLPTIPFILTREHGGEYDDEAFGAGWNLAILDSRLALADVASLILPPMVFPEKWKAQADLIAMARGMIVKVTPLPEQEGYAVFRFLPASMQSDDTL